MVAAAMTSLSLQSPSQFVANVLARVHDTPERLAAILDEHSEPLIAFTSERKILAANAPAERFFGYGRHELDSRPTDELVPERLRQPGAPPQVATRDIASVEIPGLLKGGSERPVAWTFGSVPTPNGPLFVVVIQDGDTAAALMADAQFRLLADTIPVLAWFAEPDGQVTWYNQRWFDYTGMTSADAAGWGLQSVHDPAELPRVVAKWKAALESGQPWEDEFRLRRHDGQFHWFLSRAMPLRDASGRIVRWFGTNVDIDVAKRSAERVSQEAQAQLRWSEAKFHQLVDAISDYAIFMLDSTGRVASWNPGVEKIKGYTEEEILGQHLSIFYTPEDRAAGKPDKILETVRREGRFEDESWRVRKDGSRFWANVVITALRDEKGELTGFAKVTRDLTARRAAEENERRLAQEQLARAASEAARKEMERVNRAKDEFLATMSHELRTPLNAITGWATILRRKPRDEEKLDRGLEVIERNAEAQTRLVSDLMDVSRIISGKLQLEIRRTEVLPLIFAAADVVRPAAEGKGMRLVVDVDPDIGATMADPDRLQQVMWNLLINAIRYTPRGGRVTVSGDRSASGIVIRVQDSGAGIAPEHLPRVFDRFMQADASTTREHGGLGLGLSIVRHLVEAHGGTVEAHSEGLGRGATFTVKLPIRAVNTVKAQAPPPARAADTAEPGTSLRDVRILIVDDDRDSLDVLREVLGSAGAQVTMATNAREAFDAVDGGAAFELIISDIGMPEVDGYSLLRRIRSRERDADIPAIALTAYAHASDAEHARRAGFQEHLTKPVDERELLRAVRTWSRQVVAD
ncbi:MAG TPA: PAS domain S-box protein [Polyangiaceae bacterium]|jgi:hypothetical protein